MASSKIRMNYHQEAEALVNKQINMEFYVSQVYLSMAAFFKQDDQALHGFAKYFKEQSEEERGHGIKFMAYQAERGGKVVFQDVAKPASMEWGSPLQAMEAVLELEKTVSVGCTMLSRAGHTKIIVRFATTTTRQRTRA